MLTADVDLVTFGQRLRHLRRSRGLTLSDLGERVGRAPSQLSLLENGRREPKLSLLQSLAAALEVPVEELLRKQPPSRRAQLEIALEEAQRDPLYKSLGMPHLRVSKRMPNDVIEHLLALYDELRRSRTKPTASPEEARKANAELRRQMHERGNYFGEIEEIAAQTLEAIGYRNGALSQGMLMSLVGHFGFTLRYVQDLPRSVRSITDMRHRRIYLEREQLGMHTPRTILLQTLGHIAMDHDVPRDFADFLRQRVEANYFAAAMLIPAPTVVPFLLEAKANRELSVEDLADVFSVSYEMAAHRFTNLATHHLDLPVHFTKNDESGTIYKAYAND
jgi:transcriptional regulator with XRE-family HTH domain